jgi:type III secretory pathway component EscT
MAIMNLTIIFIAIVVVSIAVFDIYIIIKKGKYESISAHIIRASHKHPSIPFLIGFVAGHLFWSMDTASWSVPLIK